MTFPSVRGAATASTIRFVVAMLAAQTCLIEGFQGVSTATRPAKAAKIQTTLAPIHVDFRDVAEDAGLTAINVTGGTDRKKYILESTGAGVAIFDFDNDGLPDVFLVNGTTLDGKGRSGKSTSHLYRNLGNLRFEDVTA